MPKEINDGRWYPNEDMMVFRLTNIEELLEQIRDIILAEHKKSAPARNCDKYSIDDVKKMDADFKAFCRQYGAKDSENCVGCPIKPMDNLCCHSAWMLLPTEGGAE